MSDLNPDCENGTVTGGAGGVGERPLKHSAEYHPEPVCEPIALSSSVKHGAHRSSILSMSPVHAMILFTLVTLTLNLLTASSCGFGPPSSYAVSSPLQGVTQYGPRINCLLSNTHSGTTTPSLAT